MPSAQALAVIARARLWNVPLTGEGAPEAIREIQRVADLAASMPESSGYAGSIGLVDLAMWYGY